MSDRIEKEDPNKSSLLQELEKESIRVVRGDWNVHLGTELRGGENDKETFWNLASSPKPTR